MLSGVIGCATTGGEGEEPAAAGVTIGQLDDRVTPVTETSLYTPTRGPIPLADAASLVPPSNAPLKAAIYVPSCATPAARPDHVAYLQSLGLVVVVPSFDGDGCVVASDRLGSIHGEIDDVASTLTTLPWVRDDALYLVGHGIGADVATTYTRADTFAGIVALAAACRFGIQNVTPILTFRALDDAVLSNRGTRCVEFTPANAFHIEFAGNDHVMRLSGHDGTGEARTLMRNTIARFIDTDEASETIAGRDAVDLQQLGSLATTPERPPAATPPPVPSRAVLEAEAEAAPAAEADAAPAPRHEATAPAEADPAAAESARPSVRGFGNDDVIYIPDLSLPPGRY